jgi:hypothetical protein
MGHKVKHSDPVPPLFLLSTQQSTYPDCVPFSFGDGGITAIFDYLLPIFPPVGPVLYGSITFNHFVYIFSFVFLLPAESKRRERKELKETGHPSQYRLQGRPIPMMRSAR